MKTNKNASNASNQMGLTHEGAIADRITKEQELRRSVMSCMLFEDEFYENGVQIADRISSLVKVVPSDVVANIAIEARNRMKLRHVPLLLAVELARTGYKGLSDLLYEIIQRPDELTEFLAIYWRNGKCPISAQAKKGLARAFKKFDEYSLAKYNRKTEVKLKDVLFLTHAKPKDESQADLWKRLINDSLRVPDTWEVELSSSTNKLSSWTRLIKEGKLGALALLKNLRNIKNAGVPTDIVKDAISKIDTSKVLPFRFISAAMNADPFLESTIEERMLSCLSGDEKLRGKTAIVIDASGSMSDKISSKSSMSRYDAACALSILLREICEDVSIITFDYNVLPVPSRRGFALRDSLVRNFKKQGGGTSINTATKYANKMGYDRIIVITDEQSVDRAEYPNKNVETPTYAYMINVASAKRGLSYKNWTHIDGWSEAVVEYIREFERNTVPDEETLEEVS